MRPIPFDDPEIRALLVLASSSVDPDLAPFVDGAKLGHCLVVATPEGREAALGFFSPMERGEAAATSCRLLSPELLDVPRLAKEKLPEGELWACVAERALQACGVGSGKVALAGAVGSGTSYEAARSLEAKGYGFVSGQALVRRMRKRKTEGEVAEIRRVARVLGEAMHAVARTLHRAVPVDGALHCDAKPLTVGRLRALVASMFGNAGLEQPERNIIAPAEEGAVPHSRGDNDRVLRVGESLIVDIYPRDHLFADCTRTFCVGAPPEALARAHAKTLEALEWAHRHVAHGMRAWDLQCGVCDLFSAAGYPTPISDPGTTKGYVHSLGHGVGYELHELPVFREVEGPSGEIANGDVITLEPGLYDEDGGWAVRLEDMVAVGGQGNENLTPLPYALDPRVWVAELP